MRIIPKRTKVRMELFKGIEIVDVLVAGVGMGLSASFLVSNLPAHLALSIVTLIVTAGLVIPIEDDKGYILIYNVLKYAGRYKVFYKRSARERQSQMEKAQAQTDTSEKKGKAARKKGGAAFSGMSLEDITPFTGIDGAFIAYGSSYSAVVMSVPSVEFRFYSESRQNSVIDRCLGAILRTAASDEVICMVKLDRPVIYDDFIESEQTKIDDLKEAYLNGLLTDEELTVRVGIVHDRIQQLMDFDYKNKVYMPFHYLMFIHKDRNFLQGQIENAISMFAGSNMDCHQLKGEELAVFLKYNYGMEFDEREVKNLSPEEYMEWILPDKVRITTRTVQYDDLITHNFRLRDYPMVVGNAWGSSMFNTLGTKVVLKMTPVERYKAIRQIDRSIDELREQESSTGKTSKLMEVSMHIDSLSEVLRLLQGENEILFNVSTYVTVDDYELSQEQKLPESRKTKNVTSFKKQIRRELSEDGFKVTDMFLQQFEAYSSSQLSGYDAFKKYQRGIQSNSVAAAFPYVYKSLCDDGGIYVGQSGGIPVFINFFQRDRERVNSNTVIIGKSGSGKSYATKTILAQLAAENSKIFILDPENEYSKLAQNMNGKIIDVGSATQGRLNPFHIITNLSDEEGDDEESAATSFTTHLQFLEEFYRQILPGIDSDALEYLNNITIRMYETKGIDDTTDLSTLAPEDFPTFDDLYDKILNDFQLTQGEYSKSNLRVLLNYISKFATGGRNSALWNGAASISTNENFIVFNFQSLLANKNNTIANAQMLLVLKWLDNEIIKNRDYNIKYNASRKIVVVIDEAHVFIDSKYPIALDFMYQLAKRIRKYNGMQMVITQNIKDFVGTEELARKSTAIINASQYSFIFPLAPNDMQDLCTLYEKAGAINESEQEDIVNNGRGRAFVITSPSERTCVDIVAAKGIEDLFTM
ncbi:MAG TPA: ATP-binding protein [Candidatus Lachnoclostridium stercoravium]|uniref:ATP-binding protein n=1 Tax=Candidatus Lachnoclostridium stercoravium TaxID=2838633 RepID=A0A9D2HES1_9FIRM|nr:ATP-binding protein [Candidatus Lachnoclostridium stercoravium]